MQAMNSLSHRETSLAHLDAVVQTAAYVNDIHNGPDRPGDRAEIARGYDAIRQGLKIAEVHALLAVAEAVEKSTRGVGITL
jgi:plasmid stabilization system protein ParE